MKVLTWDELRSGRGSIGPLAATIGVFDGLHLGHRELVARVLGKEGLASAVVTFAKNPKLILSPSTFHGELSSLDQRLSLIDSMAVDLCVLIDFSGDFSKLPGRLFLSMLEKEGALRYLAVGHDFRCGHRLDTDAEGIREFCGGHSIEVELLDAVLWSGQPVSSSRIRKAILDGRLEDAAPMLGRSFEIDLAGAIPLASGRVLPRGDQAAPPPGVYEVYVTGSRGQGAAADSGPALVARLGTDGAWMIPRAGGSGKRDAAHLGLRLVRLVSRE